MSSQRPETKNPNRAASSQTRLNVNLNAETANALKDLVERHGITYTEAIRRAVSVYQYFDAEKAVGNRIQSMKPNGEDKRDIILM